MISAFIRSGSFILLPVAQFLQDIEATIHCAEWLSIIGGSSTGEQRIR